MLWRVMAETLYVSLCKIFLKQIAICHTELIDFIVYNLLRVSHQIIVLKEQITAQLNEGSSLL